ncbi:MAG: very short patch repair endonuclease [Hyphomonadaceae bacterium]
MNGDVFSAQKRAAIMRAVRAAGTGPERIVRQALTRAGYRYRLQARDLPGKPDVVFRGRKKAIFVHGCFWHGHACKRGARAPKANAAYWRAKIARNVERDGANEAALAALGWETLALWECELRSASGLDARLRAFLG